jgi:hypothetical protein
LKGEQGRAVRRHHPGQVRLGHQFAGPDTIRQHPIPGGPDGERPLAADHFERHPGCQHGRADPADEDEFGHGVSP